MDQRTIFIPFFGVMILTILVWIYMYYLRLSYIVRNHIDPQSLAASADVHTQIPAKISMPSENLINLFELPVLFYATCLYLYVTNQVGAVSLTLAYAFLIFRATHSIIHCTYNKVTHRFYAYILSSITLWLFIFIAMIAAIND